MKTIVKWAGSKSRVMQTLKQHLPAGDRLVEPFAGSCSVMMNTDYPAYLVADINPDLISLYKAVADNPLDLIARAKHLFETFNSEHGYYDSRHEFNHGCDPEWRAATFLFLNRHCFNGLCRYNQSGAFNVPFGKYKNVYFPEAEILAFAEKAKRATFLCCTFEETLRMVAPGDVVYCDPPYLVEAKGFTNYHSGGFGLSEQNRLALLLSRLVKRDYPVVASNADLPASRAIYRDFNIVELNAPRSVGASGDCAKSAREIQRIKCRC